MDNSDILEKIEAHYTIFFYGHECTTLNWALGPIHSTAPWFKVLCFGPGPKTGLWTYASVGTTLISDSSEERLEFILIVENPIPRAVEILSMISYYHRNHRLGLFHTIPIGEPWIKGATCDHFLISLPYPFGPELEVCSLGKEEAQVLWLLPITKSEVEFKKANGADALEELFDKEAIEYWKLDRKAVV